MEAHHDELIADVKGLVDKYRAIVEWDVPEMDEAPAEKLIMKALHKALNVVDKALPA